MRGCRWLLIGKLGLGSCLLAGCLRAALPPETSRPYSTAPIAAASAAIPPVSSLNGKGEKEQTSPPPSDYLTSQTSAPLPPKLEEKGGEVSKPKRPPEKLVEPVEMRIPAEEPSLPVPPPAPPLTKGDASNGPPHMEIRPAPLTRPDPPSVQVLRALLEAHPEEEIKEKLKPYDPSTREVIFLLLASIAQLEQSGGLARISPRDLAAWTERLNTLTTSLHSRSQLILERMCFCSYIKNFGVFAPLPPEHTFFQPGEDVKIYVQARNLSSRRQGDKYVTVLKGRLEIYDENSRDAPPITWADRRIDVSASPRQDFYINFHFQVPLSCPAGLYTLRITVEDWTDAPPDAKQVPERRIAHCTLDFRVGGPVIPAARNRIAGAVSHP